MYNAIFRYFLASLFVPRASRRTRVSAIKLAAKVSRLPSGRARIEDRCFSSLRDHAVVKHRLVSIAAAAAAAAAALLEQSRHRFDRVSKSLARYATPIGPRRATSAFRGQLKPISLHAAERRMGGRGGVMTAADGEMPPRFGDYYSAAADRERRCRGVRARSRMIRR